MKIIFMGTPDFSVPSLKSLIKSENHEICAVYCQPPRPAKRGQKLRLTPVHQEASNNNINVYTPLNFKNQDDINTFISHEADIAVVAAYGLLLPEEILNAPKYGCINIHSSILPRWRGAAPINRAIIEGDKESGVTIMQMDKGLDTGDMLLTESLPISNDMNAQELHDKLSDIGADLLIDTLKQISENKTNPIKQDDSIATYAKKLKKEEGKINWDETAQIIKQKILGLNPWPGTYFNYNSEIIKIISADIIENKENYESGTIIDDMLTIACSEDAISPKIIQRQGKKPMDVESFLRGYNIPKGAKL